MGDISQDKINELIKALRSENSEIRGYAADALLWIDDGPPEVIDGLLEAALCDEDFSVRLSAILALGHTGKNNPQVAEGLLFMLGDKNDAIRQVSAFALGNTRVNNPEVVKSLIGALRDENCFVRHSISLALRNIGKDNLQVTEGLLAMLGDEHDGARLSAALILGHMGVRRSEVVKGLLEALRHEDWFTGFSAAQGLKKVGDNSMEVIRSLQRAICDNQSNDIVVFSAAQALRDLGGGTPEVVEILRISVELVKEMKVDRPMVEAVVDALYDEECLVKSSAADEVGSLSNGSKIRPRMEKQPRIVNPGHRFRM